MNENQPESADPGDEICRVCGGRAMACFRLGHRRAEDRGVKWHPKDLTPPAQAADSTEPVYRKVRYIRAYAYRSGPAAPGVDYWYWNPEYHRDEYPPLGWFRIDYAERFEPIAAEAVPPASCAPAPEDCAGAEDVSESIKVIREIMKFIRVHASSGGFEPALAESRVNARLDKIAAAFRASNAAESAGCSVNPVLLCVCARGTKSCNVEHAPAVPAGLNDAERYQKLRGWMSSNVPEGWEEVERLGAVAAWVSWEAFDSYLDALPVCNVGLMGRAPKGESA